MVRLPANIVRQPVGKEASTTTRALERAEAREKEAAETGHLLGQAARALGSEIHRRLRRLGYEDVRVGHAALFAHIDDGGSRITDLARRAGMTKQSMGELVFDLEGKGYVERAPDPADARAKMVRLTAKGRKHLRDARRMVRELEADVRERVGERRLRELHEMLGHIAAAYHEEARSAEQVARGRASRSDAPRYTAEATSSPLPSATRRSCAAGSHAGRREARDAG